MPALRRTSFLLAAASAAALAATAAPALASAAPATSQPPAGFVGGGYLVRTDPLSEATVQLDVPRISCTKDAPTTTVRLGIFTDKALKNGRTRTKAIFVEATCTGGTSTYKAQYGAGSDSFLQVRAGEQVSLLVNGDGGYEIDTNDESIGRGGSGPGDVGFDGKITVGARIIGARPRGVSAQLRNTTINGAELTDLSPTKFRTTKKVTVGDLSNDDFSLHLAE